MKTVMHVAEPFATGVLSFLADLTRRQVEEYEVYILWGERPLTPANVERLFDPRVHLVKMDSFRGAMGTVFNPAAYRDVRRWYDRIRPDIVHLHSSASGFVGRWALPVGRVATLYTPHGYSFLMRDGDRARRAAYWLMEWLSARRRCTTVACSEGEWREARRLSRRATYVNNGISLGAELAAQRVEWGAHGAGHQWRAVTSGRILHQKNPRLFNEIARLLPEVQFTWIGEGALKTELTAPNVKVTGWVTREECLRIVREADFFVLPSLWEGLSISLLEAMYMKKLCIVSDVTGNHDVIHTDVNGFVCCAAEDYAAAIRRAMRGEVDARRLTDRAARDVETQYNVDVMAARYSEIYRAAT